ncbi:hypothetical protein CDAR_88471 [Caerostris darwini]|uniref:Uncharacterized protein n=1 Tax=Caerostris darwini TaxID=1538125 RepID=A0AAV4PZK9_9ARAC|nr:hypothetical protein CDAR_88471 [Caerostris darwini]
MTDSPRLQSHLTISTPFSEKFLPPPSSFILFFSIFVRSGAPPPFTDGSRCSGDAFQREDLLQHFPLRRDGNPTRNLSIIECDSCSFWGENGSMKRGREGWRGAIFEGYGSIWCSGIVGVDFFKLILIKASD